VSSSLYPRHRKNISSIGCLQENSDLMRRVRNAEAARTRAIDFLFRLTRVARAEQRLSQDQLARMAGVTRQTISSIENGQYCPSALLAFVLARKLEKPVAELFYLEEKPS